MEVVDHLHQPGAPIEHHHPSSDHAAPHSDTEHHQHHHQQAHFDPQQHPQHSQQQQQQQHGVQPVEVLRFQRSRPLDIGSAVTGGDIRLPKARPRGDSPAHVPMRMCQTCPGSWMQGERAGRGLVAASNQDVESIHDTTYRLRSWLDELRYEQYYLRRRLQGHLSLQARQRGFLPVHVVSRGFMRHPVPPQVSTSVRTLYLSLLELSVLVGMSALQIFLIRRMFGGAGPGRTVTVGPQSAPLPSFGNPPPLGKSRLPRPLEPGPPPTSRVSRLAGISSGPYAPAGGYGGRTGFQPLSSGGSFSSRAGAVLGGAAASATPRRIQV